MNNPQVSVVIGAGPLGQAVVRSLRSRRKSVRLVSRAGAGEPGTGLEIVRADASEATEVRRFTADANVVYFCAKPAYTEWPEKFPPLLRALIEGVPAEQARIVYADNLYTYGPTDQPLVEDLPPAATGPKGRTRTELVEMLLTAHRQGRVRATIGRCSDFFGPGVIEAAMGARVFEAARTNKPASVLGKVDALHTQAFIDDVAAGLCTLGERDAALGEVWHLPAAETITTRRFLELVYAAAGTPVRFRAAPRWLVSTMGLVNAQMRELKEVLYAFERPLVVDHGKFARAFGPPSVTAHGEAIRQTLAWFETAASAQRSAPAKEGAAAAL